MILIKDDVWTFQPGQTLQAKARVEIRNGYWHRRRQTWTCGLVSDTLAQQVRQLEIQLQQLFLQFPSQSLRIVPNLPDPIAYHQHLQVEDLASIWKSRCHHNLTRVDFTDPDRLGLYRAPQKYKAPQWATVQLTGFQLRRGRCESLLLLTDLTDQTDMTS